MLTGKDDVIAEDSPSFDYMVQPQGPGMRKLADRLIYSTRLSSEFPRNDEKKKGSVWDSGSREEKRAHFLPVIEKVVDPQTGGSRWQRSFCIRKHGLADRVRSKTEGGDRVFCKSLSEVPSQQPISIHKMERRPVRRVRAADPPGYRGSIVLLSMKKYVFNHKKESRQDAWDDMDHKESNVLPSIKKYVFNDQKQSRQDACDDMDHKESNVLPSIRKHFSIDPKESRQDVLPTIRKHLSIDPKESKQDVWDEEANGELDRLLYSYRGVQLRKPKPRARNNSVEWAARKTLPNWSCFEQKESRQDALDEEVKEVKEGLDDDLLYPYLGAQPP